MTQQAIFISRWKERMYEYLKVYYGKGKLDKEKTMKFLDDEIQKHMKNHRVTLVNNYTNSVAKTDILSIIDLIENNHLIIGGGGVLYAQHSVKFNPLIEYITYIMAQRKLKKKERAKYDKSSYEWLMADISQLNYKIIINSFDTV